MHSTCDLKDRQVVVVIKDRWIPKHWFEQHIERVVKDLEAACLAELREVGATNPQIVHSALDEDTRMWTIQITAPPPEGNTQ